MVAVALFTPGFLTAKPSRLQITVWLFMAVLVVADGLGVDPLLS